MQFSFVRYKSFIYHIQLFHLQIACNVETASFLFYVTHYNYVRMSAVAFQITSLAIVYSTVYSRLWSKKTLKLRVTGLCQGNSPVTSEFPAQMASKAENVSIWWRHHEFFSSLYQLLSNIRQSNWLFWMHFHSSGAIFHDGLWDLATVSSASKCTWNGNVKCTSKKFN